VNGILAPSEIGSALGKRDFNAEAGKRCREAAALTN
jgi:hypothetical protein